MGTSLNGLTPQNTYPSLIKVGDNTSLTSTLKTLSDGIGNDLTIQASTTGVNFTGTVAGVVSGVSGAIQFSNGSAFASDAANLFYDDTNNRLGIGTNAPTAKTHIVGSGSTFATNSLLVQNSGGANLFRVRDDGNTFCEGGGALTSAGLVGTVYGLFGGASYEASASLVCGGTTQGFLPSRMTTTQKNAIASPAAGLVVYDSTTNKLCCYNGTTWNDLF